LPTATAKAPTRRARGEAFVKYVDEEMGAKYTIIVGGGGHSDRCVHTARNAVPYLFPGASPVK
jgi:hypothetical protein